MSRRVSAFAIALVCLAAGSAGLFVHAQSLAPGVREASWAPDGKHLVFASNRSGTSQIYSMLADGTKVRRLTNSGKNEGPAWSGYIQ